MKNMKISMKLIVGFMIAIILSVIVGAVGIIGMLQINTSAEDMYVYQTEPLAEISAALVYAQQLRVEVRQTILYAGDAEELANVEGNMKREFTEFEKIMVDYKTNLDEYIAKKKVSESTQKNIELYDEAIKTYNEEFRPGLERILANAKNNVSQDDLKEDMYTLTAGINKVIDNLNDCMTIKVEDADAANVASTQLFQMLLIVIIVVLAICIAVSLIISLYISGLISKPMAVLTTFMKKAAATGDITLREDDKVVIGKYAQIKDEVGQCISSTAAFINRISEIADELGTVAKGDLSNDISVTSEQDTLGVSLRKMNNDLDSTLSQINSATTQVAIGSKQIADGAQSLAQGSTEQAASVEELSSSISSISEKTKENAVMADKASSLADEIKLNAERGSGEMDEMMKAIEEINEASGQIEKVIKVIDDIAFQTNILALNAAVEAARAGAAGKGFAVVADEVRNLASKSAEAAKNTGGLIENSVEKAHLGLNIAKDTSESLKKIVEGINDSAEIVTEISKSSNDQSSAISQINIGIDQVTQVVQQNSATAQESAASAEEMSAQVDTLENLVKQFKLKDSTKNAASLSAAAVSESAPAANEPPEIASYDFGAPRGGSKY
ncbi:MAG: methyl-accepting chemotaxis protein [Oscillospiraceae bacterium]|nr:methyl-accepting chemotaxis protein [Oscillospiraceae bacterium]